MPTFYEIPTIASPQTLTIALNNVTYNLRLLYHDVLLNLFPDPSGSNSSGGSFDAEKLSNWTLDILDQSNNPLICGIPLVTGANLLEQYAYVGIGGALIAMTDGDPTAVPTFDNLGTTGHLYFVTLP